MSASRTSQPGRRRPPGRRKGRGSAPARPEIEPLHPTETPPDIDSFEAWDLGEEIQSAIREMDIHRPTPIQALSIGPVLEGRDVIAKAETGTGKTLSFGAPMMSRINPRRMSVLGLVLCPTRELAEQVFNVLTKLGEKRGLRVAFIVGGEMVAEQVAALRSGAQVVVGTPGRVLDLMNQRVLSFPWTDYVVLDEADRMLEIGFIDDVRKILDATPAERQTLLFSATFPDELLRLARSHTRDPVEVATSSGIATVDTIAQYWLPVNDTSRYRGLAILINSSRDDDTFLVFCDRRTEVSRLMRRLERERFSVRALHGGYEQEVRFRVMDSFRTGEIKALVATDIASRGLDVSHITHVVNFNVPRDISDYTHRIGRTGRAGRLGTAVTLVGPNDQRRWQAILKRAPWPIEELRSPHGLRTLVARRRKTAEAGEAGARDEAEASSDEASKPDRAPAPKRRRRRRKRS